MDGRELHKIDYAGKDYERQVRWQGRGIWDHEEYYIDKWLSSALRTLEIGTGGGRLSFGLESANGFADIVAVDFVEELIMMARAEKRRVDSRICFSVADVLNLPFDNDSFDQAIAFGVVLSHLPRRTLRLQAMKEIYRVLKPEGILLVNVHNATRYRLLYYIRAFMRFIRLFHNPRRYGTNDIPRFGAKSGRLDLLFWRPTKSTLHYYYPGEIVYDLLASGLTVKEMNRSAEDDTEHNDDFYLFRKEYIVVVAEKLPVFG